MATITLIQIEECYERMQSLRTTHAWQKHYFQKDAVTAVEEKGGFIISCDKRGSSTAAKEYYHATLRSLYYQMPRIPKRLRNFYEWIACDKPCHFYIDFEYYPDFNRDSNFSFSDRRKAALEIFFEEILQWCDAETIEVFETDASKKSKRSRHYVFKIHGHMFKNLFHCGAIQRRMQLRAISRYGPIEKNPYFAWSVAENDVSRKEGHMNEIPCVDEKVYTKARVLRLPFATKYNPKEYRPLLPWKRWSVTKSDQDDLLTGKQAWINIDGSDSCHKFNIDKENHEIDSAIIEEGMVQCTTNDFLETCKDNVLKIINVVEVDGTEPVSGQKLYTRQTNRRQRRHGTTIGLEKLDLMALGALDVNVQKQQRNDDNGLRRIHGREACIDIDQANAIREKTAPMIHGSLKSKRNNVKDTSNATDEDIEKNSLLKADAILNEEELKLVSSRLCIDIGDILCAYRKQLMGDNIRISEYIMYYWNFASSMVFAYQLNGHYCVICNRTHQSNHIKMVVLLDPSGERIDLEYPDAPVYYYKCYKRDRAFSTPRAVPMWVENRDDWRERLTAFRTLITRVYFITPRKLLAPFFGAVII